MRSRRIAAALAAGAVALLPACGLAEPAQDPVLNPGFAPADGFAPYDPYTEELRRNPVDPDPHDHLPYSIPCTDGSLACTAKNIW